MHVDVSICLMVQNVYQMFTVKEVASFGRAHDHMMSFLATLHHQRV